MSPYAGLVAQIEEELADIERVVLRTERLTEKALRTGDDGYWDAVALNLHGVYTSAEKIFEAIARATGEGVPQSSDWHKALLLQMSGEIKDVRPAVIRRQTRYCLNEYLGFRHIVRNVYTTNLRPARLQELVDELAECHDRFVQDINRFITFLNQLDDEEIS